ncbi:hypothetical protein C2S51_003437 [Perilla frutescens var. frutescens]|nr:hypothetical protein C2S51_003437 [Perilla frutescens var. frutescens]
MVKAFTLDSQAFLSFLIDKSRRSPNRGKTSRSRKGFGMMLDSLTGDPSKTSSFISHWYGWTWENYIFQKLYDDLLVILHFYVRVWVTVSQQYQVREMLLGVLHCVTNVSEDILSGLWYPSLWVAYKDEREKTRKGLLLCSAQGRVDILPTKDQNEFFIRSYFKRYLPDSIYAVTECLPEKAPLHNGNTILLLRTRSATT